MPVGPEPVATIAGRPAREGLGRKGGKGGDRGEMCGGLTGLTLRSMQCSVSRPPSLARPALTVCTLPLMHASGMRRGRPWYGAPRTGAAPRRGAPGHLRTQPAASSEHAASAPNLRRSGRVSGWAVGWLHASEGGRRGLQGCDWRGSSQVNPNPHRAAACAFLCALCGRAGAALQRRGMQRYAPPPRPKGSRSPGAKARAAAPKIAIIACGAFFNETAADDFKR